MLYFCAADVKFFYESSPLHSNYASSYHSHALIFSHCDGDQEERVAWISVVRLRSVNNHNVQDLYMETSQLPSSTMPVICPTVNQTVKQAPLLSCLTYWVQHKARSSLYVLWCGIIWDRGGGWGGITLNFFYHHVALSSGQCVCAHAGDMFSVIVHCIRSGWPFDKTSFCVIMSV